MIACAACAAPLGDGLPMCPPCRAAAVQAIAALPADLIQLDGREPPRGAPAPRVSGTHSPSVPLDLNAEAVHRAIVRACQVWEPPVRAIVGLPPAPPATPARLVERAARLLSASLSVFLAIPARWGYVGPGSGVSGALSGPAGVLDMWRLHERAVRLVGIVAPSMRVPGWCRSCGATALLCPHTDTLTDVNAVDCAHCGARITGDDYRSSLSMIV